MTRPCRCLLRGVCPFWNWQNHADSFPVIFVALAQGSDQVPFLKVKANEDVQGHCRRQHQMGHRHRRSEPDSDQDAQLQRVADDLVQESVGEFR